MIESPFATTSRIINEPVHGFDDLRIIAKDGDSKLDTPTRAIIAGAADELEATNRALVMVHVELIEARQKIIALNEQLIAARTAALKSNPPIMSMSSGRIPLKLNGSLYVERK